MSEYTVIYPIHLGQEVWVDGTSLPPYLVRREDESVFLCAEVVSFLIQKKGGCTRKSMNVKVHAPWLAGTRYVDSDRLIVLPVNVMGKTVFNEKPKE